MNNQNKPKVFFNSVRADEQQTEPKETKVFPKIRFRKVFHIQKSSKNLFESPKIFFINKKTKRSSPTKLNDKNTKIGNIKLSYPKNDVYVDDLKEKIQNTFTNQNALDIRMMKLYHRLLLEQQHQIYFTPDNSEDNISEDESKAKVKIIIGFSKKVHCNCKKSNCLKNYCECKRNHERCDKKCECEQCKNYNKNN